MVLARLGERAGAAPPSLATEEAVGAVAEAGRRTGLVGDFGRTLLSGEAFGAPFDGLFDEADNAGCRGLAAGAAVLVEAIEVRLGFLRGAFVVSLGLTGCFGEAFLGEGWI